MQKYLHLSVGIREVYNFVIILYRPIILSPFCCIWLNIKLYYAQKTEVNFSSNLKKCKHDTDTVTIFLLLVEIKDDHTVGCSRTYESRRPKQVKKHKTMGWFKWSWGASPPHNFLGRCIIFYNKNLTNEKSS